MLNRYINWIGTHRGWVISFFIALAIGSVLAFQQAHVDAIPDIGENQQIVFTEWPGRSPQDIEDQVTYPLSAWLQGIPGVRTIRGTSAFGFSTIYVIFEEEVDFYWSRSRILEKLASTNNLLPKGIQPRLGPDATGLGQVYWYTLENEPNAVKPLSLAELRSLQDFYVRYHLQDVEGVSEVAGVGGFVKEYQIDVDPKKLFAADIHFSSLIQAIQNSNVDVGAEVIEEGGREMIVRGLGFFRSLTDIENVVIGIKDNIPVRVKDVARVGFGPGFRRGALDRGGQEVVGGVVTMRFGENPREVIERLKKRLETVRQGLPAGVQLKPFYDRTELINNTMGTVYKALSQEVLITIFVIFLFLLHWRSSFLVSATLPLAVGISFLLMYLIGIDSNIMSLSGLVIAIGSMVDMAIIITEHIYASLADSPPKNTRDRVQKVIAATQQVAPAVLTAALTTTVTFLPVFALEGAEGKLFGPLAWAKTLAMLGAVFVSITLIPVLAIFFLKGRLRPLESNPVSKKIVAIYQPALNWVLDHRSVFLIAPLSLLVAGSLAWTNLGSEFMPSLNEGELLYMPVTTPDVSMTRARELLAYTDQKLEEHPLVQSAVGKLGRADTALDPAPVAMFETVVKLVAKNKWPRGYTVYDVIEDLDEYLQVPGLVNSWDFPIQTRIGMISTGIKTAVGVKIFGPDFQVLEELSEQVARELENVPGAANIYPERLAGKPYIQFEIDRVAASRFGINAGTVNQVLQTAVGGMPIGQFYKGRERYAIRVRYKKELRDRIDDLKRVLVPSPLGHHIPIEQLADIKVVTGPAVIQSENGMLRSLVLLNVRERDLVGFVEEARGYINEKIDWPSGYSAVWAGQYENQVRASKRLSFLIPLVLLVNLLLIYSAFRSWHNSAIIYLAVPIAMAGGLIFLWWGGYNLSVAVWVGFIALIGIAVDDGVVMMTFLRTAMADIRPTNWSELKQAILQAGTKRIRPLFMTTTTTIVALLPVLWSNEIGSEVMKPMALPIIGGMTVEMITLFVVPVVYSYLEQRKFSRPAEKATG